MIKYYIIKIVRLLTIILRVFPINCNRALFYSFSGKEISDSPKYIADYLSGEDNSIEIIWAVNNPRKWEKVKKKNWKIIKYKSLQHLFYGSTAKITVTNTGPYKAISYRKNQEIINTWHGGGAYKKTGMDNPYKEKSQILYNKNLAQKGVTLFLSSSEAFTKYVIRGAFGYNGKIIECGLPRNDILLNSKEHKIILQKVKKILNIKEDIHFVLYAPTWRNYDIGSYEKINLENVLRACEKRFGGNWIFVHRGHNLSKGVYFCGPPHMCVDAAQYPDMQELMIAADILISDYSSCIWDFSLTGKPCFLFVPDIEHYVNSFDFYTPIKKWGFDVCNSNEKLCERISKISIEEYQKNVEENHKFFGNRETGEARSMVCRYIESHMGLR